jgi:ubiquinone/menaquinone biosynthesis C-methylase UbiE
LHFDVIADAYDVQIPESRRLAVLNRKTELMREVLQRFCPGRRGLDVGCGQGAYVARMRDLGFEVAGIDASAGQVALASRNVGAPGIITTGSVLRIPAVDRAYDFVYVINVLHHLASLEEQRRAMAELARVLRPGGLLLVHEINTRNVLFRFYMGYVFPSLNCIDEGVERWLLPDRMAVYTDMPVADIHYFTFLPDVLPQGLVRLLTPIERLIEDSRLGVYSAHYMAVLRKPA